MSANKAYDLIVPGESLPYTIGSGDDVIVHSLDLSTDEGKIKLASCLSVPDYSSSDCDGLTMAVEHVVMRLGEVEDEKTGEMRKACFTTLVSPTGETYGFSAVGTALDLKWIIACLGCGGR